MIVLVVGMHRSGTSALAGMLHSNGIIMGEQDSWHPKPMRENPKGFFENKRFRMLNDQILRDNGYKVKSFNPDIPPITQLSESCRDRMEALIKEYNTRYPCWGWKDPRTCLTLRHWFNVMAQMGVAKDDVRILIPCRATRDIAASMLARGNKGSHVQFEELTRGYNKQILVGCNMWPAAGDFQMSFKTVQFEHLIYKTETVAQELSTFLDYPVTDTTFIEPTMADRVRKKEAAHG